MKPWKLGRWALYGAIFGVAVALLWRVIEPPEVTAQIPFSLASLIGNAIGGAAIFVVIAAIRNAIRRPARTGG